MIFYEFMNFPNFFPILLFALKYKNIQKVWISFYFFRKKKKKKLNLKKKKNLPYHKIF